MSDLTEHEILLQLRDAAAGAADDCMILAGKPHPGPTYRRMRERLALMEGCCRQMAAWREDARWLPMGLMFAECHKRAGEWLRKHHSRKQFTTLAALLRGLEKATDALATKATGRSGMILPKTPIGPHRDTRPVQVMSPGGIILNG